jgi:GNAT superfamily N-acetyltransferase
MSVIEILDAQSSMPDAVSGLLHASLGESICNVAKLVRDWIDVTTRFDGPGEVLLIASLGGDVVGVGGLLKCRDVPGALRVSRLYVLPEHRRRGVASALAAELLRRSTGRADVVSCNAQASSSAGPFWESMGFKPVKHAGITHTWSALDIPDVVPSASR